VVGAGRHKTGFLKRKTHIFKNFADIVSMKNRIFTVILIFLTISVFFACEKKDDQQSQAEPKGFTFFNIGANTVLTSKIEKELEVKLGNSVTERWSTIDLTTHYNGFLQQYFKDLYELHKKLRTDLVLKIEDNPIKLTYRHTRQTPFEYVELIFSSHSRKPLLFKIRSEQGGPAVINEIKKKHGEPKIIVWDEKAAYGKKGRSSYWQNDKDIFMISVIPDRYEKPEYYITIYYVGNMEEELRIKQEKQKAQKNDRVKNAF